MKSHSVLPWCIRFFVNLFFRDDLAEQLLPDLEDEYVDSITHYGRFRTFFWVIFQCVGLLFSGVRNKIFWTLVILKENIKIAFRNLRRYKKYSILNIFGLSVGLACSVIIILYVNHELTYDNFHPDVDRIFRVDLHKISDIGEYRMQSHCTPLAEKLRTDFPQVEIVSRIRQPLENSDNVYFKKGDIKSFEDLIYFTDSDFFQIFKVNFISGDPASVLDEPNTVILTESLAKKFFGDENAFGKNIEIELDYDYYRPVEIEEFKVVAIIEDSPSNSHLQYNALVSFSTMLNKVPSLAENWTTYHGCFTYLKLNPENSVEEVEDGLIEVSNTIIESMVNRYNYTFSKYDLYLQPISEIHMYSPCSYEIEAKGNMYYIYIYSFISLLILFIGCMNYMNLSASISSTRIREIGIRKVIGANRAGLSGQFISESFIITGIAFFFALFAATLFFPFFNEFTGTSLSLSDLINPKALLVTLVLYLVISLGSAFYPIVFLTDYKPIQVLKGKLAHKSTGSGFQRLMVLGQFVVSIFLIISTLTVQQQLNFMRSQALGFDREQKLVIPVHSNRNFFMRNSDVIKEEFEKSPNILNSTVSSEVPGENEYVCYTKRMDIPDPKPEELSILSIDFDFIDVYGLDLVAGRAYEHERGTEDINSALILNETAVKQMGFTSPEDALGIECWGHYHGKTKTIVGVVKDFHFIGMQENIKPTRFEIERSLFGYITLTVSTEEISKTLDEVMVSWDKYFTDIPFEYFFLDESFDQQYRYEMQASKILGFITFSGLVISLLGLLGLASFIARKREKEIGIRKVLGATSGDIINLLSKQFIIIITISFAIAAIGGWFLMNRWLQDFAYRINLDPFIFIVVGVVTLLLALLTVGFHGLRVSHCNPIKSIRNE